MLGDWRRVPEYQVEELSRLIPKGDLGNLITALESTLDPASQKQVAGAATLIATAWPFAWQRLDDQTADAFAAQLNEEMCRYPADVLHNVIRSLRRTQKFAPAIAEIVSLAEAEMMELRNRLKLARRHEQEHARRTAAALEEEERRTAHRRELQARLDHLVDTYGPTFARWTVDDVEAASHGITMAGMKTVRDWMESIEAGDKWVDAAMSLIVIAGRAWPLYRSHQLPRNALCVLLRGARCEPDNALAVLNELTAAPEPKGITRLPAILNSTEDEDLGDPSSFLADLVAEIRGECAGACVQKGR